MTRKDEGKFMVTFGEFVFVKGEKRTKDNNTYCNVTLECVKDEDVVSMACEPSVFDKLKKYSKYQLAISKRTFTWDGKTTIRETVVDAKAV